jgi:hypothetical protein
MSSQSPGTSSFFPADNPAALAHVNLLQGIIGRLAGSSASCKTWCLTLVGGLVGLAGATHQPKIIVLSLVPIAALGFLDLMYLAQETAYRGLFNEIVGSMQRGEYTRADCFKAAAPVEWSHVGRAFLSWSIAPLYVGLTILYFAAAALGWFTFS